MNAWWQHFDRALSPEDCEALIAHGLGVPAQDGTIGHGGKSVADETMRRSVVRWLNRDDEFLYSLFARIEKMALQANANAFGFDLAGFHEVQFTEYDAGQAGHYDWHEDNCWKHAKPFDRKMSMVIQLSDPATYEGGKLLLHNDPLPDGTFVNQGSALFFPAFNRHKVTPLTAGKRYSLVTWFVGPQFR